MRVMMQSRSYSYFAGASDFVMYPVSSPCFQMRELTSRHGHCGVSLGNFRIVEILSVHWVIDAGLEEKRIVVRDVSCEAEKLAS